MNPTEPNTLEIWYDGECGLCARSRAWCEANDPHRRLRFRDFRATPDGRLPVPRHQLESSMWVGAAHGEHYDGFDGWRRILLELHGWSWLGRLAGVPPMLWFGPPLYRLVARWRHRLTSAPAGGRGLDKERA